ncbi:MAG TPA: ABC transporter ATP-binding protein [Myxococcales bacterium]
MELITLRGVLIGYGQALLPPLDLVIGGGDRLGILGPNGAGKSTLLRTLIGLVEPLGGRIEYPAGHRPRIGYVPQSSRHDPAFPLSALEVVVMGRYPRLGLGRRPGKADRAAAQRQLELVGLGAQAGTPFRDLSGGQRQRTLVARALVGEPELLVLDEPTSEMDLAAIHDLLHLVDRLAGELKASVLFVSHQISTAAAFASSIVLMNQRTQLFRSGPALELLTSQNLSQLYGRPIEVRREGDRTLVWMASAEEAGAP